ncbi:glycosyltransferase [Candidatus Zixiibacteriota bacterium]
MQRITPNELSSNWQSGLPEDRNIRHFQAGQLGNDTGMGDRRTDEQNSGVEMTRRTIKRKSPLMWLLIIATWIVLAAYYNRLLWPLFAAAHSWAGTILVALALLWINVVWFYGVFHIYGIVFSLWSPGIPVPSTPRTDCPEHIAILYTTCNDFCARAAESCLQQDYPAYTVYILDDSSAPDERKKVNEFVNRYAGRVVLIRRDNHVGFKAGNLNHALRTKAGSSPYFSVVDADEILPPDFLSRTIRHMQNDQQLGFVQINHRYRHGDQSQFARLMSRGIDLHWDLYLTARNRFGFVMFYGHGALIRTAAWRKIGGFPEVVSEDIAFATKIREQGFYGMFLPDVVAEEAFPESYRSFLGREAKIIRGTMEFIQGPASTFFRSRPVSLMEKIDLVASAGVLFLPVFFMGFLFIANCILPLLIAVNQTGMNGAASDLRLWFTMIEPLGAGIHRLWSWDFYLLTVVSILSPLFYQMRALIRSPFRIICYAAHSTAVYLSTIPAIVWAALTQLSGRRPEFISTGDRQRNKKSPSSWLTFSIISGLVLLAFAILANNIALITVAISFLLYPIFLQFKWHSPGMRLIAGIPFILFVAVFGAIPFLLIGVLGALAAAVPAHH